jgi:hypothetical protein
MRAAHEAAIWVSKISRDTCQRSGESVVSSITRDTTSDTGPLAGAVLGVSLNCSRALVVLEPV